ncbi:MAG TPA: amino acid adenylation domain-containing protein, partial [Thermoanaerobaculia bacterium]|nr:amino acid adenylation domain-containing protein [Thermoanaerobaculia bacterium]
AQVDLAALPPAARSAARARAIAELHAGLDLAAGPLLRAVLFDDRLFLLAHHLVVDGVSWRVLVEDLETAYRQAERGERPALAATTPYGSWARRLAQAVEEGAFHDELDLWLKSLAEMEKAPSLSATTAANTVGSASTLRLALGAEETAALLREVPQAYRTRINDVLLAALGLAFSRWSGAPRLLVELEGHGREEILPGVDLSRTVGWFTALFPVLLDAGPAEEPGALLKRTKERLRRVPNGGLGFGALRFASADPEVRTRLEALPRPAVLFNYLGQVEQGRAESPLLALAAEGAGPGQSPRALRGHLFEVNCRIEGGRLEIDWTWSRACHEAAAVERLAGGYLDALRELVAHCRMPEARGTTPSDFPLARVDQAWLDALAASAPEVEDVYPLSPMQQGMLFHSLFDPAAGMYVAQLPCELRGALDLDAFRRSWETLAARHEALRSAFLQEGLAEPLQVIFREARLPWVELDWRGVPAAEQEEHFAAWLREDRVRGFDTARAPLTRFALIRLADDRHKLVWTLHQMVVDGWSLPLLFREVFALYEALRSGRTPRLEAVRPYRDYIAWLRRQSLADAETWWRGALAGFATPTPLPGGRRAGAEAGRSYAERQVQLTPELTAALQTLARDAQVTLNTLVQAAWGLLLGRWSGAEDVVFGVVVSGRPAELPGIESMVGLFINSLPLRLRLAGEEPVAAWLQDVQERQAALLQLQHTPLVQVQGWSEVERGRSLFDSILVYQNYPLDPALAERSPGALDVRLTGSIEQTNYPLTLVVFPGRRLTLNLKHDRDLFDAPQVERLLAHLGRLLQGMAEEPQRRLAELPMLTGAERRQLLEHSPAGRSFPVEAPLHQLFERQAALRPQAPAVVCDGRSLTYGELDAQANRLARHLLGAGVTPGSLVGLCLERDLELVVSLLAVLKAGCAYVPLDGALPADRLAFLLADSGVEAVVTQESQLAALPETAAPVLCLEREAAALAAWSDEDLDLCGLEVAPEQAAYVIYTSGSTGRPKGVVVSHANAVRLFSATDDWFGFGADEVWTLFHSYAFDFSVWELWGALLYGGRLVVVPYWVSRSPESFHELLVREKVTVLSQTPSAFRQLMRADEASATSGELSLRWVVFGGEALELGSLRSWYERHAEDRPRLVNMYGITETTVHVTYREISAADAVSGTGSRIGAAIPDLQVYVLDRHQELVPEGVAGELCVGGDGLAWGYLGRPELTAERFVPNPFGNPTDRTDRTDRSDLHSGSRLYRSGDLGRWVAGDLEYLGRIDHQVKVRGFRIELGEIESVLGRHEAVRETVVLARAGESGEARLVAYVVFAPGRTATAGELRDFAGQSLPEHMVPSAFVALPALPLTSNGKVDRKALPAPEEDGARLEAGEAYVAPRTREERVLAEVWAGVLGVERVGVHDNFFALGGDSILSLRIMSQAREQGVEVALQDLFEHQTIARLTAALRPAGAGSETAAAALPFAAVAEADRALLPPDLEDVYPLSRLQAGMLFHSSFNPESVVYHNVWSVRVTAPFDEAALREAVRRLVARHPVLRTSFDLVTCGEPLQLVHAAAEAPVAVDDLRGLPGEEQRARIESWLAAEQRRAFDWTRPPLVRFQIHRLSDAAFHFGLTEHHAILDGWSVASLTTELFLSFARLRQGDDDGLAAPTSTFREVVALEREALRSEEHRGFWESRLAEAPVAVLPRWPAAEAPGPLPRIEVPVSRETSGRLKRLAGEEEVPVKSVLLAAHLRVIQLLCGQSDLVTGLVASGRPEGEDGERVLGLFLNTLPLRVDLPGGTWRELVRQAFAAEREMLPFRRYPLAELQKARGGAALFETAFNFTHFHVFSALDEVGGVEAEESRELAETEIPLIADFNLEVGTQRIRLGLTAGVGQLTGEQAQAIAGCYAAALEALAADPGARYELCPLLAERERRQILDEWNRTAVDYPAASTVPELFTAQAARTPEAVAVVSGRDELTYGELDRRANRLARHLRSLGVETGDLVGLYMDRCPEMVVALLGILKAGAAYVAFDPAYPPARLAFLLEDTAVPVVLSLSAIAGSLPPCSARVVRLDADAEAIGRWSAADPGVELTPEHLVYVSYTSGSTGRPKGVEVRHRGVLRLLCGTDFADFSGGRTLLQLSPIAFDASTVEIWGALLHGGRCVLLPQRVPSVAELGRVVRETGVDTLPLTTSLYNAVIDEAPEVL